jgi:hypothetical protein
MVCQMNMKSEIIVKAVFVAFCLFQQFAILKYFISESSKLLNSLFFLVTDQYLMYWTSQVNYYFNKLTPKTFESQKLN